MMINVWIWTENNIGDEGARMISESLKSNTTLKELGLQSDEMNNGKKFIKKMMTNVRNMNR